MGFMSPIGTPQTGYDLLNKAIDFNSKKWKVLSVQFVLERDSGLVFANSELLIG